MDEGIFRNVESCILNNGLTSRYFKLERGVRQGDPLSASLFVLCLEVLTASLMANDQIKGLTINNYEYKLVQYADDLTAVLKDKESVDHFITELKAFEMQIFEIPKQ